MAATIQTIQKPTRARALDTSGNNNHGQIYSGRALEFDGVTDYLDCGTAFSHTSHAICVWAKITADGNNKHLFGARDANNDGILLFYNDDEEICYYVNNTDMETTIPGQFDNTWVRIVATSDGSTQYLYINGVLHTSQSISETVSTTTNVKIGARNFGGVESYFNGALSDLQAWNTHFTAADALYDYNNPEQLALNRGGTSLTNSNLKIWYPMNDGHRGQQSYVLDASNTGLGDTVVTNGTFDSDTSGWTGDSGCSLTWQSDGTVLVQQTSDYTYAAKQTSLLVSGTSYKISFRYKPSATGTFRVRAGGSGTHYSSASGTADAWNSVEFYATADGTTLEIGPIAGGGNIDNFYLDDVVVLPINDKNHATTVFKGDELITVAKDKNLDASNNWDVSSANWSIDGNSLDYDGSGGGNTALDQTYPAFVAGRTYEMKFNTSANDTIITIKDGDGSNTFVAEDTYSSGTKTVTFVAPATTDGLMFTAGGSSGAFAIDWINIKEVGIATGWTDADQQLDIPQTALQSYNQLAWFDGYKTDTAAELDSTFYFEVGQTINMWVFPNSITIYDSIFGARETENYVRYQKNSGSFVSTNELVQFEPENNTAYSITATSGGTLEIGEWGMYTFIWNADRTIDFYINGEKKGASTATADTTDGKRLKVGHFGAGYGTSSLPFEGAMTEISHYTDILTQAEINNLYNDGKAKSALEASGSGGLSLYLRNSGLSEWKDLKGSNDANVDSTETMLITAGADATRDSQGFLMNRQRLTNSLNLDYGENSFVEVPDDTGFSFADDDGDNDSAFSITAWVYMEDCTHFKIANKLQTSNQEWIFHIDSNDKLYLTLYDNSTGKIRGRYDNTTLTSREGEWVHLACTYSGDESDPMAGIDLYIDGTAVDDQDNTNTGTYSGMERKTANLIIGAAQTNSKYSNGKIDDLCIYSKELSATEVTRNYNAGKRSHR